MLDALAFSTHELWLALACVFLTVQIACICTTVYLHRALSHRAVTLARPVELFMRFGIWLTTGIDPRQWAAVHRKHHKFADLEGDPHSPYVHGFWQIQLLNYSYYRREAANPETIQRYTKDIAHDGWDRLFDRTWLGLGLFFTAWVVAFGPVLGALAIGLHVGAYIFLNASINGAAHWVGYQRFKNSARNLWVLALLTGGEGLHNNHHEYPGSSRFTHRWWEIDFGWYVIAALRTVGLARPNPSVGLGAISEAA
ncbi:MAG TPA: fatty acid desaturase [Candidatus Binatia bacterium]|nr:fatty acid desaturase [Candidatus Binatia bacterium]